MDQTLRFDRDLVLAHSLQRSAGGAATKSSAAPGGGGRGGRRARARNTAQWSAVPDARSVARLDGTLTPTPEECTLEGARRRHGHDALSWWDQPGIFETAAFPPGAGALALSELSAARGSDENAKTRKRRFRIVREPRFWKSAPRGVVRVAAAVGAGLVGTAATTHAMVELGRFAAKLERAAMAASLGAVAPKRNELRSERWFETDAFGNTVKRVFVDAVNVATPYRARGAGEGTKTRRDRISPFFFSRGRRDARFNHRTVRRVRM